MQITLDEPQAIHNRRRPLVGGQPTFKKILKTLSDVVEILPNISLRINTDKENIENTNELLTALDEYNLTEKVYPYLGYVEPTNNCYSTNKCLNFNDFSIFQYNFDNILVEKKFSEDIVHKYPLLRNKCCGADSLNSYVVAPNGDLYKCWSDIGMKEYVVGNLIKNKTNSINTKRIIQYLFYDPKQDEECNKCKFLLLCMGGCPRRQLDKQVNRCTSYKYTLEIYLQKIANTLYEKNDVKILRVK